MKDFQDFGRAVDEELKKLRRFFEKDIRPPTQQGLVRAMRAASSRLAKLADELERDQARTEHREQKP